MLDYVVCCGRFQPFTNAHLDGLHAALQVARHAIVLCRGVDLPRSIAHPWSFAERRAMLQQSLSGDSAARTVIYPAGDNLYLPRKWADSVRDIVATELAARGDRLSQARIGVADFDADNADVYEYLDPPWSRVALPATELQTEEEICAEVFRREDLCSDPRNIEVPHGTLAILRATARSADFAPLRLEFAANEKFRAAWSGSPWPPTFVTVDAILTAGAQLLLVQRGRMPGRGLWALPGGFVDPEESLLEACIRELCEETQIIVPRETLVAKETARAVFDAPKRSVRGRTITHVFQFSLPSDKPLPTVRGGDDASAARWVEIDTIRRRRMFEDHYAILQAMLGLE